MIFIAMEQLKKIKDDLPNYRYVPIKRFRVKEYQDAVTSCQRDHQKIIYYVVKNENPLVKKMIQGGFIHSDTVLILLHQDNYVYLSEGQYNDREWLLNSLQNGQ